MKYKLKVFVITLVLMLFALVGLSASKVSITMWDLYPNDPFNTVLNNAVKYFESDFPNVKIERTAYPNDPYKVKLKIAMGSGNPPDIFASWGGGVLKAYVDAGLVEPLDEIEDWLKAVFSEGALSGGKFNGHYYIVPAVNSYTFSSIYYRKDIFEKYGKTPPKTWEEFIELIKFFKDKGYIPIAIANKTQWQGCHFYESIIVKLAGRKILDDLLAGKVNFDNPVFLKAAQMLQELTKIGAFPKGFNGMDYDSGESRMLFYSGKAVMILTGTWFNGTMVSESPETKKIADFFIIPGPASAEHPTSLCGYMSEGYSLSSKCKNKKEALMFLKYLLDPRTIDERIRIGYIVPVKWASALINEPLDRKVAEVLAKAEDGPMPPWDQFLPPEIIPTYKSLNQQLIGMEITPEEFCKKMAQTFKDYWSKHKQ